MVRTGRPAITPDAATLDRRGVIELHCGHLGVAWDAQVARVVVDILAAQGERLDMVDASSEPSDAAIEAMLA